MSTPQKGRSALLNNEFSKAYPTYIDAYIYIDSFWTKGKPICRDLRQLRGYPCFMATTSFQLGVKTEKYFLILPELIQSSFKCDDSLGGDDLL